MYIYELPFDINRELCRLLDMDDIWKELAGEQMKYAAFHIIEIEQIAKRQGNSPTHQLFTRWGQLNQTVEALFIHLYRMKHVPALRCLKPIVDESFHRLLAKLERRNGLKEKQKSNDENGNVKVTPKSDSGQSSSIPLPVLLLQMQGGQSASASNDRSSTSESEASSTDQSKNSEKSNAAKSKSVDDEIAKNVSSIPKISYEELALSTNNWDEKNLLGKGGFGQVFKGEWIHLPVAVKKLKDNDRLNQELIREMCLNHYRHDNILPLYGYSIGGPEPCLVYQLMTGGSLQQRIHRDKNKHAPLTWPERYRIAHGVARGLQYLHNLDTKTPLIHGDIKPANILLDTCLMPKIGDFGLARKGDDKSHQKVSKQYGTAFYLPKEYRRSFILSRALDTYSYGVVILEMATACMPARKRRDNDQYVLLTTDILSCTANAFFDIASLEDPDIKGTPFSNPALCIELITLGLACTRDRRQERPTMLEVYKQLDAIEFPNKHYS